MLNKTVIVCSAATGLFILCSTGVANAAPNPDIWLKTADAMLAEAELIDNRNLRNAVTERAAELYRMYAYEESGPKGAEALVKAGKLYVELGGVELIARALECATMAAYRPDAARTAPDSLLLKARIYRQQREWGRAVRAALNCAERFPRNDNAPLALFEAAQVFESNIRNTAEADKQYTRIISSYPASPVADQALLARAALRAADNKTEEAIADYLMIVDKYPKSEIADQALFQAINIYDRRLRDFVKAHELAVRFRELFPHSGLLARVERVESRTLRYVRDAGQ